MPASALRQAIESARALDVRLSPIQTASKKPDCSATGASRSSSGSSATPNSAARCGMIRPNESTVAASSKREKSVPLHGAARRVNRRVNRPAA